MNRRATTALVLALLVLPVGCSQSKEDVRDTYCQQVNKDSKKLTRIADEGGADALLTALPTLEGLAEKSPNDLKDEWQTYLNALRGWRDALESSGLVPADVAKGVPRDLPRADRRRVLGAVSVLRSPEVRAASSGIEQQALDVCDTSLL